MASPRTDSGEITRASVVPLLLFSILFGVVLGVSSLFTMTQIEHWQHAMFGVPYGQIAFAAYCAMARRPGRWTAVPLSVIALLVWNAVMLTLHVQVSQRFFLDFTRDITGFLYQLHARTNTGFLLTFVWLVVVSTYVKRSYWSPQRTRLTLRHIFAIVASAAVLLALCVSDPNQTVLAGALRFHLPHFPLYFLIVGAAHAPRFPVALGMAAILVSGACGFLSVYPGMSPWTTVAELSIYGGTLFTSLMALRVADRYANAA